MIERNDQASATAAAPERTSRRERRESPATPVIPAPVRSDDPGTPDVTVAVPASIVALPSIVTDAAAVPPVARRVAPDGPGYRAVFACVRDPEGSTG